MLISCLVQLSGEQTLSINAAGTDMQQQIVVHNSPAAYVGPRAGTGAPKRPAEPLASMASGRGGAGACGALMGGGWGFPDPAGGGLAFLASVCFAALANETRAPPISAVPLFSSALNALRLENIVKVCCVALSEYLKLSVHTSFTDSAEGLPGKTHMP